MSVLQIKKGSVMKIPRIMIAAPKSGSGKTLVTCALLGALKKAGKDPIAFKCGPDYIDPMFHRTVQKIPAENLDTFFLGDAGTRELFADIASAHDIAVIEGVMGLYDGMGTESDKGSAYDVARVTDTPVILVVDVHGMARSMLALIKGFLDYDTARLIKGVILNRITKGFYESIKNVLAAELEVPVIGYFPERKDIHLESRHLGLQLPDEIADLNHQLEEAAVQFTETAGLEKLLEIAGNAPEIDLKKPTDKVSADSDNEAPVLAVARDEAFCFYYEANFRLLRSLGVRIREFSPLHDKELPADADGILLGGGYPELYARELSENTSMRESIKAAIKNGVPSLAECGGFMYLHEYMSDPEGNVYPMVGVIKGSTEYKGRLVRFGYVNICEKQPVFIKEGSIIRAHEFHYYDSDNNGD
ncbi:MAG: cobyrinate a,c-diamide synthase, partial [Lachnospiraceae bacterium]|nr:cobyrinate a,c-diamide synthase [Lachnospiraceae bacterium]